MPRKNKKARLPKKSGPPSKIKLRKHLNADALFMAIRREFEKIPEFRTGEVEISIQDALMSAFAMFSLKNSSLLQFDSKRKDLAECNYSLSPLTANSLFQVSKHNPLGIRILVQSARG